MSYLELDDAILRHPKFVLAAERGGSAAIHMWLGLRAYCGQHLTDGDVPKFMLKTVSGPERARDREHALAVLVGVGLLEEQKDAYRLHDFLDHCRSRATILEARRRNADRQAKFRGVPTVSNGVTNARVTPSVTLPSPLLSPPLHSKEEESARASEQDTWDGSERETACPLDLEQRAISLKIHEKLAESLKADPISVLASMREFVGYWTIGAGMGQRRKHWMRKLREHVRKGAGRPGGLEAPGAAEHAERAGNVDHESRKVLRSLEIQARDREELEARKRAEKVANGSK
jgi:hypothetical protein